MIKPRLATILTTLMITSLSAFAKHIYDAEKFALPDMEWRPVPLWFWNNTTIDRDTLTHQLKQMMTRDFYGGCAILPFGETFSPEYLSDHYFSLYRTALEIASDFKASVSIYDEYGFPSGSMGAINGCGIATFRNNHPDDCIKRLDKAETPVDNGSKVLLPNVASDRLMSVVAFDKKSGEIINLRQLIKGNGTLEWTVPEKGEWIVMKFECVADYDPNVDYLSPEAVRLFVEDTHQQYYNAFADKFGTTVKSIFFDEPTMYRAEGRMWTMDFNEKFEKIHGFSPETLYPALWYDIGVQTPIARNLLFGMRARLYAEGFMKTIAEWAENHGILSTGHQDQEEVVNPCGVSGDLMLAGKYVTMPGIDKIGGDRPAELFYKVVSSSANNWDKPYVMSETFGAMGNLSIEDLYLIATEQYTKGINHLIPHAVWYDDRNVTFLPELSWRNPLYRESLPDFNRFLSRLNYVLSRPGRHVADVAVFYPINTMQASHHFDGPLGYYAGGVSAPNNDYVEIARLLTDELGVDFTYLHPEIVEDRCSVEKSQIVMKNKLNTEKFSVIILPGCKTIPTATLKIIEEACNSGVKIIFTTILPCESADLESNHSDVIESIKRMITSGQAEFIPEPTMADIRKALDGINLDVRFSEESAPFNYIHKVINGGNVYYFGNIDRQTNSSTVLIRGELGECSFLNPLTGEIKRADINVSDGKTLFTLSLDSGQSVFLIENSMIDSGK